MTPFAVNNSSAHPLTNFSTYQPNSSQLLSTLGYNIMGAIFAFLSLFGFLGNGCVLLVFISNGTLRSPTNLFIMALCLCDQLMALCSCIACAASFHQGWVFGNTVCVIEGFSVYFLGLTSMYLLAAISLDRYIVIVKPLSGSKITKQFAIIAIVICWTFGLFWAALPLVGWNHYTTEGVEISCSVVWHSQDMSDFSYIIIIFIFCLIIPLCLMVFSYVNIYLMIRSVARNSVWSMNSRVARKNQRLERKMLKTAVVLVAVYVVSWLPYTVVSFVSAFGTPGVISPLMATIPALVAKCSGLWNPLVYVGTNTQFRKAFLEFYRCSKTDSTLDTKEECKTDQLSVDVNKDSRQDEACLVSTDRDESMSLTVTRPSSGNVSPGHSPTECSLPLKSVNGNSEILELSDLIKSDS